MTTHISNDASAQALIDSGIAAARAGRHSHACELLSRALALEPRDARAWLWLSGVVASDAERRYCLEQVLVLDAANAAARNGLARLPREVVPIQPRALFESECATVPGFAFAGARDAAAATGTTISLALPADGSASLPDPAVAVYAPPPIVAEPATIAAPTSPPEIVELVVRALGSGRAPDEACRMLCRDHGYTWESARQLVNRIIAQHSPRIARRQAPLLLFLGIATLAGGVGLLAFGVLRLRAGVPHYSPLYYRNVLMSLVSGVLMVLGAVLGLIQVLGSLRK